MARVPYLDAESASPEVSRVLSRLPRAHVYGLMANSPSTFVPWLRVGTALVNELALDPALRELAVLQVGRLAQRYEWVQHVPIALSFGVTGEQVAALDRGDTNGPFDATQRALLAFVEAFVRDGEVDDEDYAALSARLSDQEIAEIAFVASQYLGLARIMTALRIDPEEPIGAGELHLTAEAAELTEEDANHG